MSTSEEFEAAVGRHQARIAAASVAIWVGSEPTFTDRSVQTSEWLNTVRGARRTSLLSFVLAAGIGVPLGNFPARRGARTGPMEALRHE